MLTNVENFQNSDLANLIRDISTILNENACNSIMHPKRSANSLAHPISQEGAHLTTYFTCPEFAAGVYHGDLERNSTATPSSI